MIVGLTGSIGMGKSTTAKMFQDLGVAVWDADAAVHRLYGDHGEAVGPIGERFPTAVVDGAVSRAALKTLIQDDPSVLKTLEAIVHPLVAADRAAFLEDHQNELVILDTPLLFETGADAQVDRIIVVSAPPDIQKARVIDRGTMTEAQFDTIFAKQVPDAEKRAKADFVIETTTIEGALRQVEAVLGELRGKKDA